ncbi:MAG TPA: glycosyltransferase [Bacteroidota bacterium]|nr:glycosyltransferase [Bacteroidota bacterium]
MNITIVGTAYPLRGGIAHYNALLAEALRKRHTVDTITFKRQYPSFLFPGKTQQETGETSLVPPAPELVDSINPFNWLAVGRLIRDRRPDLVIFKYWLPFFGPCFGTIARMARKNNHTKVLFICDNVLPHERRPGDKVFTRYAFSAGDYFIVQSAAVERDLRSVYPDAVYRFAPHPVYTIFGQAMDKHEARRLLGLAEERIVLFFGYVRRYKGLQVLLSALQEVRKTLPVRLLVVGEFYVDQAEYQKQIEDLGLQSAVTVVGDYVPNDRVAAYFSAADVVILPYLSATQSGITQIAYNFDKPVIASDVGGLAEVVKNGVTGTIVPPNQPGILAGAILEYYHRNLEATMVPRVQEEKRLYSWDYFVEAIEALCREQPR